MSEGFAMENYSVDVQERNALQQPEWPDPRELDDVRSELASRPALVSLDDVCRLRNLLAHVVTGQAFILQIGDCAEDPAESTPEHVRDKAELLRFLATAMEVTTHRRVIRVGRIAGQFTKPRTSPTELVDGQVLPVYRGHMVNGPDPDPASRRHDPNRMLIGYSASQAVLSHLGWNLGKDRNVARANPTVWTSHEALLLDYEESMLRDDERRTTWLASTHWPWLGERTRQLDSAHVNLLSLVSNPVASKVGPGITADEVVALCDRLDPAREPGRLTLIARFGAHYVDQELPDLVEAVRTSGHPVIWMCDPMHGNTTKTRTGQKTRVVETLINEIRGFIHAVEANGGVTGGLHLETTPDNVAECVTDERFLKQLNGRQTTLCDPRLNPHQAYAVVMAWSGLLAPYLKIFPDTSWPVKG
jgi:3-deoxy-7-phosphoheptulonate synthase